MKSSLFILFMLVLLVGCKKENVSNTVLQTIPENAAIEKRIRLNKNGIIFPNYAIDFNADSFKTRKKSHNKPHQSTF